MLKKTGLAVAIASAMSGAAQAGISAAEFMPDVGAYNGSISLGITFSASNFNVHGGQTLLTTIGGPLESISIVAFRTQSATQDLQIELYSLDESGAVDEQLAFGRVFIIGTVFTGALEEYTVDLSDSGVRIKPGTRYAIVVGQEMGWSNTSFDDQSWALPFVFGSAAYPDGDAIQSNNGGASFFGPVGYDMGFRLTVPAPGSAALLGLGAVAAVRRRRHRA